MTLREMGMAGVVPSTDTFNTLMSACSDRGDPSSIPHLFRRLISLGHSPDALSYTSLIAALTRIERPEDAVSYCPITRRHPPPLYTPPLYTSMMRIVYSAWQRILENSGRDGIPLLT